MKRSSIWLSTVLMIALLMVTGATAQAQVGINIFGLSKHFQDEGDNPAEGTNPGLGFHWTFDRGSSTALEFNLGAYRDSFKELNKHLTLGVRWRAWGPFEVGLHALMTQSESMNSNEPFLMPLPFLTLRHSRFAVNMVYLPKVGSFNQLPTLGFTFTAFPFGAGFEWDNVEQQHLHRRSALEFRLLKPWDLYNYRDLGIAWRRMFDEKNGLRLGYNLKGAMSVGREPSSGHYNTEIMIHYLRQHPGNRPSSWYYSTGMNVEFSTNNTRSTLVVGAAFLLGWDYRLSQQFNIFMETGATWSWYEQPNNDPSPWESSFSSQSLEAEFTLGLCAWI